eukprot:5778319-Amphidinium_carterae.1
MHFGFVTLRRFCWSSGCLKSLACPTAMRDSLLRQSVVVPRFHGALVGKAEDLFQSNALCKSVRSVLLTTPWPNQALNDDATVADLTDSCTPVHIHNYQCRGRQKFHPELLCYSYSSRPKSLNKS